MIDYLPPVGYSSDVQRFSIIPIILGSIYSCLFPISLGTTGKWKMLQQAVQYLLSLVQELRYCMFSLASDLQCKQICSVILGIIKGRDTLMCLHLSFFPAILLGNNGGNT